MYPVEKHLWVLVAAAGTVSLVLTGLSVVSVGGQRTVTAGVAALAALMATRELARRYPSLTRRARRISSAACSVLYASAYGSLDAAHDVAHQHPKTRAMLFGATVLWTAVALMWHAENDDEVPVHRIYPWESWLIRKFGRKGA